MYFETSSHLETTFIQSTSTILNSCSTFQKFLDSWVLFKFLKYDYKIC
jgi:hypothetical protein